MAEEFQLTQEMKDAIGVESEPHTVELDKTAVRMFARAVGYTDPVFYDEAEAKRRGFRSLPAPPGYLGTPIFNPRATAPGVGDQQGGRRFSNPFKRVLNGGTEIEYVGDICAGDALTVRSKIADLKPARGSLGQMLITTNESTYHNQDGKLVAIMRGTIINY